MAAALIDADAATVSMIVATTVTKPIVVSDVTVADPTPPPSPNINSNAFEPHPVPCPDQTQNRRIFAPIIFVMFVYGVVLTIVLAYSTVV